MQVSKYYDSDKYL